MVFGEDLGLDTGTCSRIATAFGGGMSHMGLTCGAVTGALMVLGLASGRGPETKQEVYLKAQEFVKAFGREHGAINCQELIGYDLDSPGQVHEALEKGVFQTTCRACVVSAVRILEEMLKG